MSKVNYNYTLDQLETKINEAIKSGGSPRKIAWKKILEVRAKKEKESKK